MDLHSIRISKGLTQQKASIICSVPLRSYKRLEIDTSYINSLRYKECIRKLEEYDGNTKNQGNSHRFLVIGAGYVGLSLSLALSQSHEVSVVDINKEKVDKINNKEPMLNGLDFKKYFQGNKLNLKAYLPSKELYKYKDFIIIALPTDYDETSRSLNTSLIEEYVKDIRDINKKALIVIKSTCNIGFTGSLNDKNLVYSPEFLRESKALLDTLYPARIIIGGDKTNKKVKEFAKVMQSITLNRAKLLYMSLKEAEAVKLFSNAYLALRVSFFNELDSFASSNQINSRNIIDGVSLDPRIGEYYNNPSFGYGGYCLPKDTLSLINTLEVYKNNDVITSINRSNVSRKEQVVDSIVKLLKERNGHIVGIYQASNSSRYSPLLDIMNLLRKRGVEVSCFNPDKEDIISFKNRVNLILLNRYEPIFDDVKDKIYTRDVYRRD